MGSETFRRLLAVLALSTALVACGGGSDSKTTAAKAPAAAGRGAGRFACLDFQAKVTAGPDNGRVWTGDLVLNSDANGVFTGYLAPKELVDRGKLTVTDTSKATCRAVGQRNGLQISWFLYCANNERIFGTGQITTSAPDNEELRGVISGPDDADTGVYHGRNYPPYIRIISPAFS
jgi:hypothetical protein